MSVATTTPTRQYKVTNVYRTYESEEARKKAYEEIRNHPVTQSALEILFGYKPPPPPSELGNQIQQLEDDVYKLKEYLELKKRCDDMYQEFAS